MAEPLSTAGGIAAIFGALPGVNTGLFGDDSTTTTNENSTSNTEFSQTAKRKGLTTEQLKVDEEGLLRLIQNSLQGQGGLASIFSQDSASGLFNSSASKEETGNLFAKIAGEIALLTGKKETAVDDETVTSGTSTTDKVTTGVSETDGQGFLENLGFGV